jgi:hypothetical protein
MLVDIVLNKEQPIYFCSCGFSGDTANLEYTCKPPPAIGSKEPCQERIL